MLLSNMSWKIDESQIKITNQGMDASRMSLNNSRHSMDGAEVRMGGNSFKWIDCIELYYIAKGHL